MIEDRSVVLYLPNKVLIDPSQNRVLGRGFGCTAVSNEFIYIEFKRHQQVREERFVDMSYPVKHLGRFGITDLLSDDLCNISAAL